MRKESFIDGKAPENRLLHVVLGDTVFSDFIHWKSGLSASPVLFHIKAPPHQDVHPLFICGCLSVWRGPCLDHLLYDWGSRMFTAAYGAFSVHVFRKAMQFNSDSASFPSYENTINTFSVGSGPNFPACHLWSGHIHFTPVPLSIELIISPWGLRAS